MKWMLRACAAAVVAVCVTSDARAACNISVDEITSTAWMGARGRGYDVYDPQRRTQVVNFRVRSRDGGCPFYVVASVAGAQGDGTGHLLGAGGVLQFALAKDAAGNERLKPEALATDAEVFRGVVPAGGSSPSFQVNLVLPPEQAVGPGLYAGEIEFTLYEGVFGMGNLRDRRRSQVTAQVPAVAEISFSPGLGFDPNQNTHAVHFGSMRAGDRRSAHLKARSNAGYRVLLQSVNGGALRHTDPSDDSRVPYTLIVDGASVSLLGGAETQVLVNTETTPASGRAHALEFLVQNLGDASAGDYRDVINVTVLSLR